MVNAERFATRNVDADSPDRNGAVITGFATRTATGCSLQLRMCRHARRRIVLRNPCGNIERTATMLNATSSTPDARWQQPITADLP